MQPIHPDAAGADRQTGYQLKRRSVNIRMIALIDYGAGNLKSVQKAFAHLGEPVTLTADKDEILAAQAAVLPGVGAFGDAMASLNQRGLAPVIRSFVETGRPFLGICLGLQLLFEESEESPGVKGLGILKGKVRRFPEDMGLKIPHIGFNSVTWRAGSRLFAGLSREPYYYFVHSYYCFAEARAVIAATASYGIDFDAAVERENLFAAQFHPEKSGRTGLSTLHNFITAVRAEKEG